MTQSNVCQLLPWDSEFFGFRVARVSGNLLTPEMIPEIDDFCHHNCVHCLYFLSDLDVPETTILAENNSFHYADIRLTFEHNLPTTNPIEPNDTVLRLVQPNDIPLLTEIASHSYVASRFYYDQNFSRDMSAKLYETWIKVSCEGFAQAVWVAVTDNKPSAYITCHVDQDLKRAWIGLVGVSEKTQGRGTGKLLVYSALDWFGQQGLSLATVTTQGRNIYAQRLYQRCGFITQSVHLWYHKWYP